LPNYIPDAPEDGPMQAVYLAPRSSLEQALAKIMGEVLGVGRVGAEADFFALGGDTELASVVVGRLGKALEADALPVEVVRDERTVERIACRFVQQDDELEAAAGIWLYADDMGEVEREARLRTGSCK
jgi:mycobactin phenyloxazoline synthetase